MIVFGSRGSDLALAQTRQVGEALRAATGVDFRIEVIETTGDRIQDRPLSGIGIKGLFTAELESALRNGSIDLAVHSLKDLPVDDAEGLVVGAIPERVDARDLIVAPPAHFGVGGLELKSGIRVGTSSPRRHMAGAVAQPDLEFADIRGNVPTRAQKVRDGAYGAVFLAAAGVHRLGLDLEGLEARPLPVDVVPPAPGQGALGIQCRRDDARTRDLLSAIHHEPSARCVIHERAVLGQLGGGCSMPLGVHIAPTADGRHHLRAALFGGVDPFGVRVDLVDADPAVLVREVVDQWSCLVGEPLTGISVAVVRPDGDRTGLAAALAVAGAEVTVLPWLVTEPCEVSAAKLRAVMESPAFAFTSPRAVTALHGACVRGGLEVTAGRPVFAVGPATAQALRAAGWTNVRAAAARGGAALIDEFRSELALFGTLAFPCAEGRHEGLEARAEELGISVVPAPVYRTAVRPGHDEVAADVLLLTSPSAVSALSGPLRDGAGQRRIALGDITFAAAQAAGVDRLECADAATPAALIDALTGGARA